MNARSKARDDSNLIDLLPYLRGVADAMATVNDGNGARPVDEPIVAPVTRRTIPYEAPSPLDEPKPRLTERYSTLLPGSEIEAAPVVATSSDSTLDPDMPWAYDERASGVHLRPAAIPAEWRNLDEAVGDDR